MGERDQGKQKPLVDDLIDTAVSKFKARETFTNQPGRIEPYGIWTAAEETIPEIMQARGLTPRDVLMELVDKTSVTPEQLKGWEFTGGEESFDRLWQTISELVLWQTIKIKFPELEAEEKRRFQHFRFSGARIIPFPRAPQI